MGRSATTVSDGLKRVPPFPPVAAKLLNLLAKPEVETNEVAQLISNDATFTAKVLQRVNSVEFGLVSPVTNIRQAVALLGLDLTRQVTLSHATAAYAKGALRTDELRRCWQHTVATAVLADEIANACGEFTSVAFTAGIMHDIGRLGLLVAYPAEYERVIRDAAARCLDLLDFEREEFGMDHAEAGRLLAERWGLPAGLAQIAGRHHDPCEGAGFNLLRIIHVACRLADVLGYDVVRPVTPLDIDTVLEELPENGRRNMRKTPAELRASVEASLLEYGSESQTKEVQEPEDSLALLAAVAPESAEAPAPAPEPTVEPDATASPEKPKNKMVLAAVVGAVVVAIAAIAFMAMR